MTINSIYGLRDGDALEPGYIDCKAMNEMTIEWRNNVRSMVAEIRALRTQLGRSRDLIHRYQLCVLLGHKVQEMGAAVSTYRAIQRDSRIMSEVYIATAKQKAAQSFRAA
ncbi:hypothetical protein [Micavibrio aeruginosavorus]|nr:hypothetical protein [Micavibrio aeruginosavorus]